MAVRREDNRRDERIDGQNPEQGGAAPGEPRAIGQPRVRSEMVALAEKVIAKRRPLLQRLAAYDRGDDAER